MRGQGQVIRKLKAPLTPRSRKPSMLEELGVRCLYHAITLISSTCALCWMFVIVKYSPLEMKNYKWILFKLALCEEVFAIFLGAVLFPDPLFPAQGAAVQGLASYGGQFAARASLFATFFAGMAIFISINDCVHIRNFILHQKHELVEKLCTARIGIPVTLGIKLFFSAPLLGTMFWAFEEPENFVPRTLALQQYRYVEFYANQSGAVFLSMDLEQLPTVVFALTVVLGLGVFYCANLLSALMFLRTLRRLQAQMARSTFKSNVAILNMLFMQNMYPVAVMIAPISIAVGGFLSSREDVVASDVYKHISAVGLIVYPFMSCLLSVLMMKPYRTLIFGRFNRRRQRQVDIIHSVHSTLPTQSNDVSTRHARATSI